MASALEHTGQNAIHPSIQSVRVLQDIEEKQTLENVQENTKSSLTSLSFHASSNHTLNVEHNPRT